MNRDDLLKGHVGHDDSGDSKWEPDVGRYLGDRMQSLITQVEYKPLFGVEMHHGARRAPNLRCLDQSLEREINSCPGTAAGDDVRANQGADVIVITSVHQTEPPCWCAYFVDPNTRTRAVRARRFTCVTILSRSCIRKATCTCIR